MTVAAVCLAFLLLLAGYLSWTLSQRKSSHAAHLASLILVLAAGWGLGYLLELMVDTLSAKVLWARIQYVFIAFLPIAWLAFALRISGTNRSSSRKALIAVSVFPALMQPIVWTNELHGWVWRELGLTTEGSLLLLDIGYGPLFWVFNVYSLTLVLLGSMMLLYTAAVRGLLSAAQRAVLIFGPLVPIVANVIYTTRSGPLPDLDLTPFAFVATALIMTAAFLWFRIDRIDMSQIQGGWAARLEMALRAARADAYYWDNSREEFIFDDRELDLFGGSQPRVFVTLSELEAMVYPADRAHFAETYAMAMRELDTLDAECRLVDWRGQVRQIRLYGMMQRNEQGRVVQTSGLLQDVTDEHEARQALRAANREVESINESLREEIAARREAEAELNEHQANLELEINTRTHELNSLTRQLNALLNSTAEGILGVDRDGNVTFCNAMALAILGLQTDQELLGKPVSGIGLHFDTHGWREKADTLGGDLPVNSVSVSRPGGDHRLVDYRSYPIVQEGSLGGGVITFLDITDAEQARRRARSEAERANRIFETSAAPIWSLDRNGNITLINAAACRMLECKPEQVRGRCWFDLFVREERRSTLRHRYRQRMLGAPVSNRNSTLTLLSLAGKTRHVHCHTFTLYDDSNTPAGVVSSAEDRTDMMEIELQLEQSQKLNVLGQMCGGIAHDFNNLLQVITGSAEGLTSSTATPHSATTNILAAAEKGSDLTHRLLSFAGNQPLEPEYVELARTLESTKKMLKSIFPENIAIEIDPESDACTAFVDRGQLDNVLVNLCLNARDAMENGGTLTLGCSLFELKKSRSAPGIEPGQFARLNVTDTGTGIDDESLPHIFEPFFTTKKLANGTGLGLSMVYGFVRRFGGFVSVDTRPGKGSSFHVNLPVCSDEAFRESSSVIKGEEMPEALQLLVLEDDEGVRKMVVAMLERLGYEAVGVATVCQARAALSGDGHFDMILSDVSLSDAVDGAEFAGEVRALRPDLPVLLMSGYSAETGVTKGELPEGRAFLGKPFNLDQLSDAIRNLLKRNGS